MEANKKKILVVDDEQDLCEILKFNLETEGYQADTVNSGEEAMSMDIASYDLLLLDVMMGGMSGFQLAKQLKENPMTAHVPIIFLTARDTENDTVTGFNLGADDYITKPFDMEEVLARIESNLRRVQFQNSQTECLQYNNLTLDLEKNTAFLNGIELSLTAKEFGILELLMKYPDKVFSKSNLFQSVWDTEYIAEDNTLNVHISNLRNKLKAICSDTEFIDTVWGIGYRLHKAKD